jgi:hypothetical protein
VGNKYVMEYAYDGRLHRHHKCSKCDSAGDYVCHICGIALCDNHVKRGIDDYSCSDCYNGKSEAWRKLSTTPCRTDVFPVIKQEQTR